MGFLEALSGFSTSPWGDFAGNALSDLGYGLTRGTDLNHGFQYATQRTAEMAPQRAVDAQQRKVAGEQAKQQSLTQKWMETTYPQWAHLGETGVRLAMQAEEQKMKPQGAVDPTSTVEGRTTLAQQYGLSPDEAKQFVLTGNLPGGNQNVRAGVGQPIFGRNKETLAIEPWQSMTDGSMINIANPSANPSEYDFSPSIPAEARSAGGLWGTNTTQAALDLPGATSSAEQSLAVIDTLMPTVLDPTTGKMVPNQGYEEQFGTFMGIPVGQSTWALPNSPKADFQGALEQVKAQGFLQGIKQMQGTGAISEAEGSKATDAIINARTSTTKERFVANMEIAKAIIQKGLENLRAKASQSEFAVPTGGGGGGDVLSAADILLNSGKY